MAENFSEENYGIKTIKDIFELSLEIPNYQRPYKWSEKHTQQLLDDLLLNFRNNEKPYRIGTIVFHKEDNKYYIVDGQQRLTTLSLILYHLNGDGDNKFLNETKTFHTESIYHLKMNSEAIKYFVKYNQGLDSKFKENFYQFIIEKCSLVYVSLNDLEEAFQFFDSQNARGKALAPYDLLKAYHLRALKAEKDEEVMKCVENWERSATKYPNDNKGNLDKIINHFLFRLRQWNLGKDGEVFENKDIDIFKGVDTDIYYPYLVNQKAGLALFDMSQQAKLMYKNESPTPPFNIQQTIMNGKNFFQFIEYYRNLEYKLFNESNGLLLNYKIGNESAIKMISSYEGSYRTGDRYVRELFKCAVFAYYDRFGDNGLDIAIDRIFRWAYRIRLINPSVRFRTIENEAQSRDGLLSLIAQAKEPKNIMRYIPSKIGEVKCSKCDKLIEFFEGKNDASKQ